MGQRCAVEPRPDGDAPLRQGLSHRLRVPARDPEGDHPRLCRPIRRGKHLHIRQPRQLLRRPAGQGILMVPNGVCPLLADKPDPRQQSGDAGHIVGPGLQPVRQKVRHILAEGQAAGTPFHQWPGHRPLPAQQHAGALGAVKALVARHGNIRRPKAFQVQRQDPGGLGGIDHQGHTPAAADLRNSLHRLHKAEHVGDVMADHGVHPGADQGVKGHCHCLRMKQRSVRHGHIRTEGRQGPGDGVVLIAGDHRPAPRRHQALDSDVQPVGGVGRKHHPFRVLDAKQLRQLRPALKGSIGGPHGQGMAAPAWGAHGGQGIPHSPGHSRRLLKGGGRAVQVDHRPISRNAVPWRP